MKLKPIDGTQGRTGGFSRHIWCNAWWLVWLVMGLGGWVSWSGGEGIQDKPPTEYELKVVCIYNFLKYTDWPKAPVGESVKASEQKVPMVIGVVGKDPFGKIWQKIEGKQIGARKIVVKQLGDWDKINTVQEDNRIKITYDDVKKCQMLFISSSEQKNIRKIIGLVKNQSILTVSETKGFLEAGGIINFLLEKNKVRFEINLDAAKSSKLQIKTTVLKLAERVIQKKKREKAK